MNVTENEFITSNTPLVENNTNVGEIAGVVELVEKLDFVDIQLLRKFYMTGMEFPNDTQPYCFPILYKEMKTSHHLKIGIEALRKRLDALVGVELLTKIKHSNPTSYSVIKGKESFVRGVILKFFIVSGLTKFL